MKMFKCALATASIALGLYVGPAFAAKRLSQKEVHALVKSASTKMMQERSQDAKIKILSQLHRRLSVELKAGEEVFDITYVEVNDLMMNIESMINVKTLQIKDCAENKKTFAVIDKGVGNSAPITADEKKARAERLELLQALCHSE